MSRVEGHAPIMLGPVLVHHAESRFYFFQLLCMQVLFSGVVVNYDRSWDLEVMEIRHLWKHLLTTSPSMLSNSDVSYISKGMCKTCWKIWGLTHLSAVSSWLTYLGSVLAIILKQSLYIVLQNSMSFFECIKPIWDARKSTSNPSFQSYFYQYYMQMWWSTIWEEIWENLVGWSATISVHNWDLLWCIREEITQSLSGRGRYRLNPAFSHYGVSMSDWMRMRSN